MSAATVVKGTRASERETEGGRFGPTGVSLSDERAPDASSLPPEPEVSIRPHRRRLTAAYKLRVLSHLDTLREKGNGSLGAFLRSEGLYYSAVQKWYRQREAGTLGTMHRGGRCKGREALLRENKALRRQNDSLKKKLHKTELIVELQKKISEMIHLDNSDLPLTHGKAL
jgi:transposase